MNPSSQSQVSAEISEQVLRKKIDWQINRLFEEVARLSESDLSPSEYYGEFLQRVITGIAAPAGAVWIRTPQGNLQLQFQINITQVQLDRDEECKLAHNELLRQSLQTPQPLIVAPHSGPGTAEGGGPVASNPTDFLILLAPLLVGQQIVGLVEVWQDASRNPGAQRGYLQFVAQMASLASHYARNRQLRQITGQQQLWTYLETFSRQVHGSLNPTEVAYLVANEGRRLVECDRISVAVRTGRKAVIEAVSGADVVEKRSNLVQLQKALCDKVLNWGEKLVFSGTKDDTLPPEVHKALDEYLGESASKLLVVLPLRDDREAESKRPARSAMLMESFEPASAPEQMIARLEVVGRHAAPALYNAVEHKRIPMRWIWMPLARLQEGLGGKAKAIATSIAAAVAVLLIAMIVIPYPLKMDTKGQLLTVERGGVFSPVPAEIAEFLVEPGKDVRKDQLLVLMKDWTLGKQVEDLENEIAANQAQATSLQLLLSESGLSEADRNRFNAEKSEKLKIARSRTIVLNSLLERTHYDKTRPGFFWLKSPIDGTVLNSDFLEHRNRPVKAADAILRIGDKRGSWEIEMKIPQKHISQVLQAFPADNPKAELDVDLLLASTPTRVYRGKLARDRIGGEATPNRDDNNESEPVVIARVRIEGQDIPAGDRIPRELLVTGTEVHGKIRCGNRPMGYSLFYGVWEFFFEKVVFFF